MSVGRQGKTTNLPDDVIGTKALEERQTTWGEIPGKIVDIDYAAQTATVQPLYKPKFNGEPVDMPQLLEVPVRFTRTSRGTVTYPIQAGDNVTLRPQMRSTENYHSDGDGSASDARDRNLSDMEAFLDGGESLSNPIPNFDSENMHLRANASGTFGMRFSPDGKFKIEGSEGNLYDIIATFMETIAADELMITYGSSMGTGHRLANRDALVALAAKVRAMAL